MRIGVERDLCEGNAVCVGIAPDIFDLDDADQVIILSEDVPPERQSDVEQAITQCPRAALLRLDD
ncbi:ferredoxin [Mycolicibacterium sp. 3033]|nr:ferredoxin [Mycolicibacterium aurantiacum]